MKIIHKKKIVIGFVIILVIILCAIFVIRNIQIEKVEEILPEEEISMEDIENITIVGYYLNNETKEIERKECIINRSEILTDLYENILIKVMEKHEDENILSILEIINLNLEKCEMDQGNIIVYFSNNIDEFNILDVHMRKSVIEIIDKTLKEINGINNVKILMNNEDVILS